MLPDNIGQIFSADVLPRVIAEATAAIQNGDAETWHKTFNGSWPDGDKDNFKCSLEQHPASALHEMIWELRILVTEEEGFNQKRRPRPRLSRRIARRRRPWKTQPNTDDTPEKTP